MRSIFLLFLTLFSINIWAEISQPIQGKLENGFRYTLLPLKQNPKRVEIYLKVDAGTIDEKDHQAGVAHMIEHLVFRSSDKFPQGIMTNLHQHNWAAGRNYNASTGQENTTYVMIPPADFGLERTLDVLSQMMFHAKLTQADLDTERKIIMEEWRMRQGVVYRMNQQRAESIRADSRYIRHSMIGDVKDIENTPAAELQDFYNIWYHPNNMQLLIVGDIDVQNAENMIRTFFSNASKTTLPERNYYDPEFKVRLKIDKIQDAQSGVSQVAFLWRFNEQKNDAKSDLINQLALGSISQRLRNEQNDLPKGVTNLIAHKFDIGRNSAALGVFGVVDENTHQIGLKQVLTFIEQLKKYPISEKELIEQKNSIKAQYKKEPKPQDDLTFEEWVQTMRFTLLSDKPYLSDKQILDRTLRLLNAISLTDIQSRINQWFLAQDKIVQVQPPRDVKIEPITLDMIYQWQNEIAQQKIASPKEKEQLAKLEFMPLEGTASIISEQDFDEQKVKHWALSNGDKVVWLQLPQAKDETYFSARSSAGFKAQPLIRWQAQVAAQLINRNPPNGFKLAQLEQWSKDNEIGLFVSQTATQLRITGNVNNAKLPMMLRWFYALEQETQIHEGADKARMALMRQVKLQEENNPDIQRFKALEKLRFGENFADRLPSAVELDRLSDTQLNDKLNEQWKIMRSAPVIYYIANNLSESEMRQLVKTYLASIPRDNAFKTQDILPTQGKGEVRFAINAEPKDDVRLWLFTPQKWSGRDAMLVDLVRLIASEKLKLKLRDEQLGLYSVTFTSQLNPETHRIESELNFTSDPKVTEVLLSHAKEILKNLPHIITENDVAVAQQNFESQRDHTKDNADVIFNRLIVSEESHGNPGYLSEAKHIGSAITLENLKNTAEKLMSENQKLFISTEKK